MQSLSAGRQLYADIDEWYEHSRHVLKRMLNQSSCTLSPAELAQPLRIMRELMEIEGMLVMLGGATNDLNSLDMEEIEHKLRGIRDSIGRIVANSIEHGLHFESRTPEEYGIMVEVLTDSTGFCIEVPYDMIAMSDLYMLRSKRISGLSGLFTIRQAWASLVRNAVNRLGANKSDYPIRFAQVKVTIEIVHSLPLDPDHFWIRPVIDGLVDSGVLVNDDANHVVFIQEYKLKSDKAKARIEVRNLDEVTKRKGT